MEKLKNINPKNIKEIPKDYWFKIAQNLYQKSGEIPDPLQIRSAILISALELPSGSYSALEISKERKRINPERDRIIAEYLTNKPGIWIDKEKGIISSDFRDLYPEGLPEELKKVLSPETLAIMEAEYKHIRIIKEKFGKINSIFKADCPIYYFRLPGGIDLFMKGYIHNLKWQMNHGIFLKKINKWAKVIAIEGNINTPFGESLNFYWDPKIDELGVPMIIGHYDLLLYQAANAGFNGLFTEIDARDSSKIKMDNIFSVSHHIFPELSNDFFIKYFEYLQREHPKLAEIIKSPERLKEILIAQSTTMEKKGLIKKIKKIFYEGKFHYYHTYTTEKNKSSLEPTFLELGQKIFSDALAAIKLHLIAKLMVDGYIEKGPIIDYEGALHLSTKLFFLNNLQYAMEVVLRTINELMAGKVESIEKIYKVFENPNWPEIIKEITRLVFKKAEGEKLKDVPINFLEIYNLNPQNIMPSDREIQEIQEKIKKTQKAQSVKKE